MKLPKIELVKFSGDVREWLQFWSLFKKIHENNDLDSEDKFQYLIQTMVAGSRAENLVKSYPPTGDNYEKVIDSLKKRFGREDLQIEVYVRELLQLVLQNTISPKQVQLADLYDKLESHLRSLESLGVTTDKCAAMIFPLVESSLPEELLCVWQRSSNVYERGSAENLSTYASKNRLTNLINFLESEVQNEQKIFMAKEGFGLINSDNSDSTRRKAKPSSEKKEVSSASSLLSNGEEVTCIFCEKNDHGSAKCSKAKGMTYSEKQDMAKKRRACFNCLKVGHSYSMCRVKLKCSKCACRHVDIMCSKDEKEKRNSAQSEAPKTTSAVNMQLEHNLAVSSSVPSTFMQTLKVKLRNDTSETIVRAAIDTGSQNSYILKNVADQLGYQPLGKQNFIHLLFGGDKSKVTTHTKYTIRVGDLDGKYWCNFQVLDQDIICADVPTVMQGSWLEELANEEIKLSDVCSKEKTASVLIGADVAGKLLTGRIHTLKSGLTAVETHLGWTLMGRVPTIKSQANLSSTVSAISMFVQGADIRDLWSLDTIGIRDPIEQRLKDEQEKAIKQALLNDVVMNAEGRYEVKLPWVENHPALSDNKRMAISRLQSTTKRLEADELYKVYDAVFDEWLAEGIIERVSPEQEDDWGRYLPHRPVIKEDSTTVIRPIFDASAKEKGSPSINDCVEKGVNLIELVTSSLLHFREDEIGVVADIKKAFLQISLNVNDRNFLRFLWYDKQGNMIMFRHCRVVFGVSCSPFILGAVLNMHLENALQSLDVDKSGKFSRDNIVKLMRSFYVDNCVTSVNSVEQLSSFINDAKAVMESGSFDLRGWKHTRDNSYENQTGVLGILWDKESDTLSLKVNFSEKLDSEKVTKRSILSVAHRIFDPLGFAAPAVLCPRLLLQETWAQKLSWDQELSGDIKIKFLKWAQSLRDLSEIKVPRCLFGNITEADKVTLHTFCDASKVA